MSKHPLQIAAELKVAQAAAAKAVAGSRLSVTASVTGAAPAVLTDETVHPRTFLHRVAGAHTHLPDGRELTFLGPRGGTGEITTADPDIIAWLEPMSKQSTSQVIEVIDVSVQAATQQLQHDALALQAAEDARTNSAHAADPAISAAVSNLGNIIAQGGA